MNADQLRGAMLALLTGLSAVIYSRPDPTLPPNPPKVEPVVTKVESALSIKGWATWYDRGTGFAAAGPALRRMLGRDWRGTTVQACRLDRCVTVKLTDWCACGDRHGKDTVIDLLRGDFAKLAPLGRGVITVTVSR